MGTNANRFIRRVQVRRDKVSREVLPTFQRKVSLDVLARLIHRTPVDTGRARGNWQLAVGAIPRGEIRPLTAELIAQEAIPRLAVLEAGDTVYISNNVPYIVPLERGSSRQAPNGMVRLTIAEVEGALR